MIIQFHTPKGIYAVDPETVKDQELSTIGLTRQVVDEYKAQSRDVVKEFDALVSTLRDKGVIP